MLYIVQKRRRQCESTACLSDLVRGADISFVFLFWPLATAAATEWHTYRIEVSSRFTDGKRYQPTKAGGERYLHPPSMNTYYSSDIADGSQCSETEKWATATRVRVPACDKVAAANTESILASHICLLNVGPLPSASKSVSRRYWCQGRRSLGSIRAYSSTWWMISWCSNIVSPSVPR